MVEKNTQSFTEIIQQMKRDEVTKQLNTDIRLRDLPASLQAFIRNTAITEVERIPGDVTQAVNTVIGMLDGIIQTALADHTRLSEEELKHKLKEQLELQKTLSPQEKQQKTHEELMKSVGEVLSQFSELKEFDEKAEERRKKRGEWTEAEADAIAKKEPDRFEEHTAELIAELALREKAQKEKRKLQEQSSDLWLNMGKNQGISANDVADLLEKVTQLPQGERSKAPIRDIETGTKEHLQRDKEIAKADQIVAAMRKEKTMLHKVARNNNISLEKIYEKAEDKLEVIAREDKAPEKLVAEARKELAAEKEKLSQDKIQEMAEKAVNLERCNLLKEYWHVTAEVESLPQFFPILKAAVTEKPWLMDETSREIYDQLEIAYKKEQQLMAKTTPNLNSEKHTMPNIQLEDVKVTGSTQRPIGKWTGSLQQTTGQKNDVTSDPTTPPKNNSRGR